MAKTASFEIRPWNYEFNVYLYSSKSTLRNFELPSVWVNQYNTSNQIPPSSLKTRLIILERRISEAYIQNHRFRLADPKRHQETEILFTIELMQLNFKNPVYKVYKPCSYCYDQMLVSTRLEFMTLQSLVEEISQRLLNLENKTTAYLFVEHDLTHIMGIKLNNKKTILKNVPTQSIKGLLNDGVGYLIRSIFHSKIGTVNKNTENPLLNIIKFAGYDFDSIDSSLNYPPHRVRFIGCGETFVHRRSYFILLHSFDCYIWFLIILVLFCYTPVAWSQLINLARVTKTEKGLIVSEVLFSVIKNILEQSTPYSNDFLKKTKHAICRNMFTFLYAFD